MKDNEKQYISMKKMPICVNCIHAYVCEEYNLNRDMLRKKCAYYNDHFLDIEQHDKQIKAQSIKEFAKDIKSKLEEISSCGLVDESLCIMNGYINEIARQHGVNL